MYENILLMQYPMSDNRADNNLLKLINYSLYDISLSVCLSLYLPPPSLLLFLSMYEISGFGFHAVNPILRKDKFGIKCMRLHVRMRKSKPIRILAGSHIMKISSFQNLSPFSSITSIFQRKFVTTWFLLPCSIGKWK